jgi:hypothetical protein
LVCAVLGGYYFYGHVDESIRAQVERRLSELYPSYKVHVTAAKLIEREGFEIRGVSFGDTTDSKAEPVLYVDEILVRCRPSLDDLLNKNPRIQEIIARHVVLNARRDTEGAWNFAALFELPTSEAAVPNISLENGAIRIAGQDGASLELRNLQAKIGTQEDDASRIQLDVAFTGNHLQRCFSRCVLDRQYATWTVAGNMHELAISPELQTALPKKLAVFLTPLTGLEARTNLEFQIQYDNQLFPPTQYDVIGKLADGRWSHTALAFPVTDLTGDFHLTHTDQRLENVTGRYGDAVVQLFCQRDGVAANSPIRLRGNATQLRVDRNMVAQFPRDWQQKWQHFQPLGLIDVDFQIDFAQGRWIPQADVHCRDVSFVWDKHPYPVERAEGEVRFRPGRCVYELQSISEKQPVRFQGDVHQPGPTWTGWAEAYVDRPIPLDERVMSAMSDNAQQIVRAFSPRGEFTMFARAERAATDQPPYQNIVVDFRNGSVRHDKFPYPLQNVSAHLERHGDDWQFTNIVGQNDGAVLTCEGDWQATTEGGSLKLHFAGSDLPLEDELRQAVSPTAQHLWTQLRPQGALDSVRAVFQYELPSRETQLVVNARKLTSSNSARGHSLSLNPTTFPYRIDDVNGSVTVSNDQIRIDQLRGTHGKVALTTSGLASVSRDGPWQMTFSPFAVDRLRIDDEVSAALPPQMRRMLDRLQLSGPVSLGGSVVFAGNARNSAATRASWNLDVDLENGQLQAGLPLEHVTGTVHLEGRSDTKQGHCRGRLNIDSVICNGLQLTNVKGPLWIDRERMLLGKRALPAGPGLPPERLTARIFGGNLSADVEMTLDEPGQFEVAASLENAKGLELTRALCDTRMTGQAWANLNLTGNSLGTHTWTGNGSIQLRNTNLYELPVVLSLLNTLRTGSSDRTAFTSSDVAFHLKGKHIYFDQLDLLGDALTLKGVGEMDMQRQVNLNFYTVMGREDSYFPAIRPLLGMASKRFLLVHVNGSVNNPTMSREVLPGLNDTLRQLFPETEFPDSESGSVQIAAGRADNDLSSADLSSASAAAAPLMEQAGDEFNETARTIRR